MSTAKQLDATWSEAMDRNDWIVRMTALADMVRGFTLTEEFLSMYEKLLAPLGYDKVCQALETIMAERDSNDPFPSIKAIRAIISPQGDPQAAAVLAAHNIVEAVRKDGH